MLKIGPRSFKLVTLLLTFWVDAVGIKKRPPGRPEVVQEGPEASSSLPRDSPNRVPKAAKIVARRPGGAQGAPGCLGEVQKEA